MWLRIQEGHDVLLQFFHFFSRCNQDAQNAFVKLVEREAAQICGEILDYREVQTLRQTIKKLQSEAQQVKRSPRVEEVLINIRNMMEETSLPRP